MYALVKLMQLQSSATHLYQCVKSACIHATVWLPLVWVCSAGTDVDICSCTQGGCRDIVRESAVKIQWERELELGQYCILTFGPTLYQLSMLPHCGLNPRCCDNDRSDDGEDG